MDVKTLQDEVVAKGKARRGEFSPKPGSAPHKAYLYWLDNALVADPPRQENFCHFWRVVVIWAPFTWLTLNVVSPVFDAVFLNPVSRAIGRGIRWAFSAPTRFVKSRWNGLDYSTRHSVKDWTEKVIVGIFLLLFAVTFGALLLTAFKTDWRMTLAVLGAIVTVLSLLVGLSLWVGSISERRDAAREAARHARINDYYAGRLSFDEYWDGPVVPKKPGIVKRFFSGVKDMLILLVQIVRVNKWKICPLVEIPKN